MVRATYSVKEKLRGGKRWRTTHIFGRGKCTPKTVATKFKKNMKKMYGNNYIYKIEKCK